MLISGLKVAALFVGYGFVGFGGDYAVGLLAQEPERHKDVRADVHVEVPEMHAAFRHSGSCDFEVERRVRVSASATQLLRLHAGSGELSVEGREGLDGVQAVGRACASDQAYLADLQLTVDRVGDDIVLSAHYPDRSGGSSWRGNDYARLDLVVEIPMNMAVDLEDSSGSMEIRGTGALTIDDSSGDIGVVDAAGSVTIDDSSGEIRVEGVRGDVEIDDGSGEITLSDVTGSVRLRDGSGAVNVRKVTRDVVVDRDGSGSISVRDVGGDFQVRADGSGGIRYSGVAGAVDVPVRKRSRGGGS
ncbi:MAG TPA: hypothetical protein VLA36_00100 [Longimicrobiales bacterium]|nr:hypothetical protein [Longimicrobiales bacterium]